MYGISFLNRVKNSHLADAHFDLINHLPCKLTKILGVQDRMEAGQVCKCFLASHKIY